MEQGLASVFCGDFFFTQESPWQNSCFLERVMALFLPATMLQSLLISK